MGINFPMFLDLQGTWPHFQHEFIDPIIPGLLIPSEYSSKLSLCRQSITTLGWTYYRVLFCGSGGAFQAGMPPNFENSGVQM